MWTTFKKKVTGAVNKHVPMRKVKRGGRPVWMTREILAAIRRKNRVWEAAKNTRSKEEFKAMDKRVKKIIRSAKRSMEKKLADGSGGNSRSSPT